MTQVNSAEAKVASALRAALLNIECNVFIDNYEVDILVEKQLVIEVDGYHHYARDNVRRDARKEQHLLQAGYRLLRVKNADVHDQTKLRAFVEQVKAEFAERPGADIPANTPLAQPLMQQLMEQLLAKEQQKSAEKSKRQRPAEPVGKQSDRALFLDWLEREPMPDQRDGAEPPQKPRRR